MDMNFFYRVDFFVVVIWIWFGEFMFEVDGFNVFWSGII